MKEFYAPEPLEIAEIYIYIYIVTNFFITREWGEIRDQTRPGEYARNARANDELHRREICAKTPRIGHQTRLPVASPIRYSNARKNKRQGAIRHQLLLTKENAISSLARSQSAPLTDKGAGERRQGQSSSHEEEKRVGEKLRKVRPT